MSIGDHFYQTLRMAKNITYIDTSQPLHYCSPPAFLPAMSSCHMGVQVLDPGEGVPCLGAALHPTVVRPLSGRVLHTGAHMFPH